MVVLSDDVNYLYYSYSKSSDKLVQYVLRKCIKKKRNWKIYEFDLGTEVISGINHAIHCSV